MRCYKKKTRPQFWFFRLATESAWAQHGWVHTDSVPGLKNQNCGRVFFFWHRILLLKKIEKLLDFDSQYLRFKNSPEQKLPHFRKPQDVSFPMVVPWIWFSIWKFWVIRVLVSLVFQVFSTAELTSPCKNSEFGRLSLFIDFFALFHIVWHRYASK